MNTFDHALDLAASPAQVYAAISDPVRLARWWGPAGFTNTFEVCEFREGGRWHFVMHGPDGGNYPNQSVFARIVPLEEVVVRHESEPRFHLTIGLSPSAKGTLVCWAQRFDSAEVARKLEAIVVPANEQNLQRLGDEVRRGTGA